MTSEDAAVPPVPQPVLTPLTASAIFLVMTMRPGAEAAVREVLAEVPALQRTVGFRVPEGRLAVVASVGSDAFDRLYAGPRPAGLHPFRPVAGDKHHAVATPGDLLFHIRARHMDQCFEVTTLLMDRLRPFVDVVDEVHGFKFFEVRDLLGFVDGTENPTGPAAEAAVTVGSEDPAFAGASYVIVQKYIHDLGAWNALDSSEQERVIGRTKLDNVELAALPPNSHVAVNTLTGPGGTQLQILRDNMPFGNVGKGEFGTYYIAYSASPAVTEAMLTRMFVGDPPGNYDRILDFSTALTGSLFFVPTTGFLENPPPAPAARASGPQPAQPPARSAESLGIGSLRGRS
ncbi:MAG TPA: Dyp-type peroxidase [Actinomycetota bacterium]|nr:Dyp-type peroxidase [Actinomycetota bacterium]